MTQRKDEIQLLNNVLYFIDAEKPRIMAGLFPKAVDSYHAEWYERSVFAFWCHLALGNQEKVINMAIDFYDDMRGQK